MQTGNLDDRTVMKMKTPRCGNPDKVEKNILSRTKRDVIQGNILFKKLYIFKY